MAKPETKSTDDAPGAEGKGASGSAQGTGSHQIWTIGFAVASGAAAGLLLLWSPCQETFFGLVAGAGAGLWLHQRFAALSHEKHCIKRIMADDWEGLDESPRYVMDARKRAYWVRDLQSESLRWMNAMMSKLWPYLNEGISRSVIETLEPMLHSYKPSMIQEIYVHRFTLGEVPFSFSGMQMIKEVDAKPKDDVLEFLMDIRWAGDVDIAIAVNIAGSDLCQVKVKDMHIGGTLRVVMRPFLPIIPCFGSLSVSFEYPPDIDFRLKMTGALAGTNVVNSYIRKTIRDYVETYYVWPKKMVVPMFDEKTVPPKTYTSGERAILQVTIMEAKGLRNADLGSSSDPFVEAYVNRARVFRSKIKHNSNRPEWNEDAYFVVRETSQLLFVSVSDSDKGYTDTDLLGRAQIGPLDRIQGLVTGGEVVDQWFELGGDGWYTRQKDGSRSCGTGAGMVRLRLKYMPIKELRALKTDGTLTRSPTIAKAGQVQGGIIFFRMIKAVNIGTGSLCARAKVEGHATISTPYSKGVSIVEGDAQEEEEEEEEPPPTPGGEDPEEEIKSRSTEEVQDRWWSSEVVWPKPPAGGRDGFYNVKSGKSLQIEVLKVSKKVNTKSVGFVDIPLALIANPEAPVRIRSLVALEGLPKGGNDPKYAGASVELVVSWIPLDSLPIPSIDAIHERLGNLFVRVCSGRGLRKTDLMSDPDPFVVLRIGTKKQRKTRVLDNNRNPEWMEEFSFLRSDDSNVLLVTVWDEGPTGSEHMGDVAIPLRAIRKEGNRLSGVWKLQNTTKGAICMDLAWVPYSKDNRPYQDSGRLPQPIDRSAHEPPLWGPEPVDELVPPFAFDTQKVDVEVDLRGAVLMAAAGSEEAPGTVHCRMSLNGTTQSSKAIATMETPSWNNEKFQWKSVPQFAILDICILGSTRDAGGNLVELGNAVIDLRDVRDAGDSLEEPVELDGDNGTLDLGIKVSPNKDNGGGGASGGMKPRAPGVSPGHGACLNVTLQGASDLMAKDINGKSDPACWLKVREQRFKSTTQFRTLNPTWNEHFQFLDLQPEEVLEVKFHDYDRVGSSSPLGHVLVNLQEVVDAPGHVLEKTWKLQDAKKGNVSMKLVWLDHPSGPPSPTSSAAASPLSKSLSRGLPSNASPLSVPPSTSSEAADEAAADAGAAPAPPPKTVDFLKMTLHSCTDLPKSTGGFGLKGLDCYVKAVMGESGQEYRSPVVTNAQNPVWEDEQFIFNDVDVNDMLNVRLADKNPIGKHVLGYVLIPVKSILSAPVGEKKSFPCASDKGEPVGSVELSFVSTA